jgi:hypothetical protein
LRPVHNRPQGLLKQDSGAGKNLWILWKRSAATEKPLLFEEEAHLSEFVMAQAAPLVGIIIARAPESLVERSR